MQFICYDNIVTNKAVEIFVTLFKSPHHDTKLFKKSKLKKKEKQ